MYNLARSFADNELSPKMQDYDETEELPLDTLRQAAQLGFGAIYLKEDLGGSNLTRLDASIIFEALASGDTAATAMLTIHQLAAYCIDQFGSQQLREKYIPQLINIDKLASYCLTEPGAGSDAGNLGTSAKLVGDKYVLNGSKAFISAGGLSDIYVVMARTGGQGAKGISAFVVEKGTPGLSFGAKEKKVGWNCQPTRAVIFEDCAIPKENLIGKEGEGFKFAMMGLDGGRLNISSCSLGAAQASLEQTIDYVKDRKQFNRSISDFQNTQFKLAEMATQLQSARTLVRQAASLYDQNSPVKTSFVAMSKIHATELSFQIIDQCLQLHGGYGYLKDYKIQQFWRDSRVHRILEGTNEVMKLIVGKSLLKE
ncbi:acyl-CoA dehydrogenase domain-containing protein [Conidiobolus coronatus NRRL 28638]|uniref:Isobutyryl-CoA dehydrogenase, mitochondrial n=1 Tax=Conidiobolus coronatus (strain ATCC 28846 / CBS 209.66 / NRRL 28638) TaxID=796925 RepID=A0A137NQG7_CONC2|nr:acyl-CoA dehydrogenase domain-containing protein [Conidiobolus coronatus NRRL 28638]|eukprot:KXN64991.1 acyl-CoA dehydrogenase domain-containing protein [Conidiobolus coronatus NRRL 28638]